MPVEGSRELAALASSFNDMADQLEWARAAERAFLLSVSHELKTPLTAIRGYAEALEEGALPVDEGIEVIQREAARLEALVQDLLQLARMNRAEFSVRSEPIDLARRRVGGVQRYDAKARSFGVRLALVADGPAPAIGDGERMLQVTSNLVENALRRHARGRDRQHPRRARVLRSWTPGPASSRRSFRTRSSASTSRRATAASGPSAPAWASRSSSSSSRAWAAASSVTSAPGGPTRFTVRLPSTPLPAAAAGADHRLRARHVLRALYVRRTAG